MCGAVPPVMRSNKRPGRGAAAGICSEARSSLLLQPTTTDAAGAQVKPGWRAVWYSEGGAVGVDVGGDGWVEGSPFLVETPSSQLAWHPRPRRGTHGP